MSSVMCNIHLPQRSLITFSKGVNEDEITLKGIWIVYHIYQGVDCTCLFSCILMWIAQFIKDV